MQKSFGFEEINIKNVDFEMKCKKDFAEFKVWCGNLRQISCLERWNELVFKIAKGVPVVEFSCSDQHFEEYKRQRKFLETGNVIRLVSVEKIEMVQFISEDDVYVSVPFDFPLNYSLLRDSRAVFGLKDLKNNLYTEEEGFKKIYPKITSHPFCVSLEEETKFDIVRNSFNIYEQMSGQDAQLNDVLSKPLYFIKFYFEEYFLCSNVAIDPKSSILELFYIPAYYPIQLESSSVHSTNYARQVYGKAKCANPFLYEVSLVPCNQYEPIEVAEMEAEQKECQEEKEDKLENDNPQDGEINKKSEILSPKKKRPSVKRRRAFHSSKKNDRMSLLKNSYDKTFENRDDIIDKNEDIETKKIELFKKAFIPNLKLKRSSKSTSNLTDFIINNESNLSKLDYARKLSVDHFINPLYFEDNSTEKLSNESSPYHSVESFNEIVSVSKVEVLQAPQNRPLPPIPPIHKKNFSLKPNKEMHTKIQDKNSSLSKGNWANFCVNDTDTKSKNHFVPYENLPIPQKRAKDKKEKIVKNNTNRKYPSTSTQAFMETEKKEGQEKKHIIKKKLLTTRVSTSDVYKYKKRTETTENKTANEKIIDPISSTLPKHTSTRSNSIVASLHTLPRKLKFWRNSSKNVDEPTTSKLQIFLDEQQAAETFNDENSFKINDNNEFDKINEKIKEKSTTKKFQRMKTVDNNPQTKSNFNTVNNRISKSNDSNDERYDTIDAEVKNLRKYSRSLEDFSGFMSNECGNNNDDYSCYEMIPDNKIKTPEVFSISSPPLLIKKSKIEKNVPELVDNDLDDGLYNPTQLHETTEKDYKTEDGLSDVYLIMQSSEYLHPDYESNNANPKNNNIISINKDELLMKTNTIPKNEKVLLKNDSIEDTIKDKDSNNNAKVTKNDWLSVQDIPMNVCDFNVEEVVRSLELLGMGSYGCEFESKQVDGSLLLSLDVDVLMEEFDLKKFDAIKLIKFSRDGWRPKINRK